MLAKHYLRRRIVWLLVIKLMALIAIYSLFFNPKQRVKIDDQRVENKFFPIDADTGSGE